MSKPRDSVDFRRDVQHPFRVQKVMPARADTYAQDFQRIIRGAWRERFHDAANVLSEGAIKLMADPDNPALVERQRQRIAESGRAVMFFVARSLDHPAHNVGMSRVETYSPLIPFKRKYPNLSDLEVYDPILFSKGQLSQPAMGLFFVSLEQFPDKVRSSVYSEAPNTEFNDLLKDLGYEEVTDRPKPEAIVEPLGDESIQYVHFVAESVLGVCNNLRDMFPFLARN